jgi:ubiquinone/menaquinone biosynthesis C-methylase UbiE
VTRPVVRLALFVAAASLIFLAFNTLYAFRNTLYQLDTIESERNQWQHPAEIIRELNLREGNTVVDLGSGAGYFALKLSPVVGKRGQVLAVDLRRLSLLFLWARALQRGENNVQVVVGTEDDPHLAPGSVDSVLICNTYHEFHNADAILDQVFRSLRRGGRLVVVDRGPRDGQITGEHQVRHATVEAELTQKNFEIVSRQDRFIDRQGDEPWWLLTGRKP